jgi:hypothetical protein
LKWTQVALGFALLQVESEENDMKGPKKEIAYTAQQIRKYIGQADDGSPMFSNEPLGTCLSACLPANQIPVFLSFS